MSDTFDAAAHAAGEGASAPIAETNAPQVESTAEPAAQIEDSAPSEEDTPADPTDAPETPSRGDKRVQQLLQERHQLRERLAFLEGASQRQQTPAEQPKQVESQLDPAILPPDLARKVGTEPKPDAFPAGEFDPQYLRAVAKYEVRLENAFDKLDDRIMADRQAKLTSARTFFEQADKLAAEKSDFRETVGRFGQSVPDWAANTVAEAGAEIAYAIAKDAEVAARIRAARTPAAVAREIGRIEERLARAKDAPIPQPTSAPDPAPRAVRGGNVGSRDPSSMPMSEYAAWSAKNLPPVR